VTSVGEGRILGGVRPEPGELLQSLRVSLTETIVPALEDRWARYVAAAMDLVLQHLQLRLAGEVNALTVDNADIAQTLAGLAAAAAAKPSSELAVAVAAAIGDLPDSCPNADLQATTTVNEALRAQVVAVLRALDAAQVDVQVDAWREELMQLVRRQLDRVQPLVEPLHMSFSPSGTP
jgi:hypothetical protein